MNITISNNVMSFSRPLLTASNDITITGETNFTQDGIFVVYADNVLSAQAELTLVNGTLQGSVNLDSAIFDIWFRTLNVMRKRVTCGLYIADNLEATGSCDLWHYELNEMSSSSDELSSSSVSYSSASEQSYSESSASESSGSESTISESSDSSMSSDSTEPVAGLPVYLVCGDSPEGILLDGTYNRYDGTTEVNGTLVVFPRYIDIISGTKTVWQPQMGTSTNTSTWDAMDYTDQYNVFFRVDSSPVGEYYNSTNSSQHINMEDPNA
jgi:hypothetical protein